MVKFRLAVPTFGSTNKAEEKKADMVQQHFPLGTLVSSYMDLSQIFSKLERNAYLRLIRTNKTMLNFAESYKNTIKFNLMRGETFEGLTLGNIRIRTKTEEWDTNREFKPIDDVFEVSVKRTKKHFTITKEEFFNVLRGSCPKELVNMVPGEAYFGLVDDLALAPRYTMTFLNSCVETFKKAMSHFRPHKVKIVHGIMSRHDSPHSYMLILQSPEFECAKSLRIHSMPCYPEEIVLNVVDLQYLQRIPQRYMEWLQEKKDGLIAFGLGGVLERVAVFELKAKKFTSFPVMDISLCVENWCAGRNKIEEFVFRIPKEFINIPNIWDFVCNVPATTVTFKQLSAPMMIAFTKDCFGRDPKTSAVEIRILTCPTKKKTAYIYTSPWRTIGFRAFDFYPDEN